MTSGPATSEGTQNRPLPTSKAAATSAVKTTNSRPSPSAPPACVLRSDHDAGQPRRGEVVFAPKKPTRAARARYKPATPGTNNIPRRPGSSVSPQPPCSLGTATAKIAEPCLFAPYCLSLDVVTTPPLAR